MNEDVVFWKFFNENTLGLVTDTSVYHWNIFDQTQAQPVKVFERNANLAVSSSIHRPIVPSLTTPELPNYQLPR